MNYIIMMRGGETWREMKMKPPTNTSVFVEEQAGGQRKHIETLSNQSRNAALYAPFALPGERTAGDKIVPQVGSQRLRGG